MFATRLESRVHFYMVMISINGFHFASSCYMQTWIQYCVASCALHCRAAMAHPDVLYEIKVEEEPDVKPTRIPGMIHIKDQLKKHVELADRLVALDLSINSIETAVNLGPLTRLRKLNLSANHVMSIEAS